MGKKYKSVMDVAARIEHTFAEIDSDVCVDLRETDNGYAKMYQQLGKLQNEYPAIIKIADIGSSGDGAVSLTAEEHKALVQFLYLRNQMEEIERKHIYRGTGTIMRIL